MIRIENIHKRFRKLQALSNIQAEFFCGQVVALIGPNGSGKTTLIKTILGLVRPDDGKILFNNMSIANEVAYRSDIGYMPQIGRYPDNIKVGQLFSMIKNIRNNNNNLDEELYYKFKLDTQLDKPMRTLSGGTRQKVSAAMAFLFDPKVLILDEPTAGLDPLSSEILQHKILEQKEKGKLLLITSHVLSDLEEITTDVMYLQDGKVAFYKTLSQLQDETGEQKLVKSIAHIMRKEQRSDELKYLKMAK